MKKLTLVLTLLLFTSSAYAGSCPMLWGKIDNKMTEIQKLRDAGKKAHDEGDHAKSEELLKQALALLNS
tara:strand:- start:219 stop:425 length:207 start_codon:yes stop_codon:yes gene_type:complete